MALPVLDGNQSATTLSSVVTGGEHIVAHSVVSLGANAISDITNAVSGSVVSISNFPSIQTIAGTVTANVVGYDYENQVELRIPVSDGTGTVLASIMDFRGSTIVPISGTVTANVFGYDQPNGVFTQIRVQEAQETISQLTPVLAVGIANEGGGITANNPLPISGTVTVGAMPNGSLTTRFGSVTTANTSFATSAVTNTSRKYLLIQNVTTGSNVITVGIGFTPTTTQGIQLTAGAGITFESSYIPTGAVYVLSSVTASNFTVLEA